MENIQYFRPTKAVIDLEAIRHNVMELKKLMQPNVQIIAVVKANAYGHGDVEVARAAIEAGATMLAVATADEAIHLRKNFPQISILVLGATPVSFVPYAAAYDITLAVFSQEWVEQAAKLHIERSLKLHIKVDTGMGRIGVTSTQELLKLYEAITSVPHMCVDGIFTHFATADEENAEYFEQQVEVFNECLLHLPIKPRIVHVANTATALIRNSTLQYDAVRYGISMYGLAPSPYVDLKKPFRLRPAFSLETELVFVKKMKAGQSIGYGASYLVEKDCYVGTLPVGYADGVLRKLSGQNVLIDGQLAPIIGRICMDQCMILLPAAYNIGEKVILIGTQQDVTISMDDWAAKLETINYEVPCIITNRVPRIYSN